MTNIFNNQKISKKYIIYKMFSWDLLFYYAIIFLFLNRTKGFSAADIFLANAFYYLFKLVFQLFSANTVNWIGKRKAIFVGNIFVTISIFILIFCANFKMLILKNLFEAIGFTLKGLCESSYLFDSLPESEHKHDIFSKIDGKASAFYFWFDAISSVIAIFLFMFNNYLPIVITLVFSIISTFISYTFNELKIDYEISEKKKKTASLKHHILSTFRATKYMINSSRMRCLLLFSGLFSASLLIFRTYLNSFLTEINVSEQYFGYIAAAIQIISAFSANAQYYFHKTYRNRTLTVFSLPIFTAMLLTSLFTIFEFPNWLIYISLGFMILFFAINKGPYYTLIKRYLNSFTTPSFNTKVYAASGIMENTFSCILFLVSSYLLNITSTSFAMAIFSGVLLLTTLLLLDYMKPRIGLKPEQYAKKDIEYIEV